MISFEVTKDTAANTLEKKLLVKGEMDLTHLRTILRAGRQKLLDALSEQDLDGSEKDVFIHEINKAQDFLNHLKGLDHEIS